MASRKFIEFFAASPNTFGNVLKPRDENDKTSALFYGSKGQLYLHQISKQFVDKVNSLQNDRNYTPEGRSNMVQDHARNLLAQLRREYKRFLDPIVHKYQNTDTSKLTAIRPAADAVAAVRRMELRQYLAALSGERRLDIFQNALRDGDEEILGCYFDRSKLFRLLGDEIIANGKSEYLQKRAPELIEAEYSGAILSFDIEKVTEEMGVFAGPSEDAQAVLAELPKLDWSFTPTEELKAMAGGAIPSRLPFVSLQPLSREQRITAMSGKKVTS